MTAFCEIIAYWYLCALSPISLQVFPQEHKESIPQCNQVKIFWEMLENNLSATQHGEVFWG